MRILLVLLIIGLILAACGPAATEVPTPLPTAVPPQVTDVGGDWAIGFQYEFPEGAFAEGTHRYRYLMHCPIFSAEDMNTDWLLFELSDEVELSPEPVYLRLSGLSSEPLSPAFLPTRTFHPDQKFIAVVHYIGLARLAAEQAASECELLIFWDSDRRQMLVPKEPFEQ